jgi:hypothetical protein
MGRRFTGRAVSLPADSSTPIVQRLRGAEGSALMACASMSCVQLALALSVPAGFAFAVAAAARWGS